MRGGVKQSDRSHSIQKKDWTPYGSRARRGQGRRRPDRPPLVRSMIQRQMSMPVSPSTKPVKPEMESAGMRARLRREQPPDTLRHLNRPGLGSLARK